MNTNKLIILLTILSALSLFGCATEYNIATGREELILITSEREVRIGQSIAKEVERKFGVVEDEELNRRLQEIGERLTRACDRRDIQYSFKILDHKEVNALSLPGGFVYINKGLMDEANDDELACVIAHEMGHIVAKHAIKRLQASLGYAALRILVGRGTEDRRAARTADFAFSQLFQSFAREDELLADKLAIRYAKEAGFDPLAMITFLEKLREINRKKPIRPKRHFRTHPYIPERIRVIKIELTGRMDFEDYINREEEIF